MNYVVYALIIMAGSMLHGMEPATHQWLETLIQNNDVDCLHDALEVLVKNNDYASVTYALMNDASRRNFYNNWIDSKKRVFYSKKFEEYSKNSKSALAGTKIFPWIIGIKFCSTKRS